jgi:hypothetical protein
MGHYAKWNARRAPKIKEPVVYRCPHCDFSGNLDGVWWHLGQHPRRAALAHQTAEERDDPR